MKSGSLGIRVTRTWDCFSSSITPIQPTTTIVVPPGYALTCDAHPAQFARAPGVDGDLRDAIPLVRREHEPARGPDRDLGRSAAHVDHRHGALRRRGQRAGGARTGDEYPRDRRPPGPLPDYRRAGAPRGDRLTPARREHGGGADAHRDERCPTSTSPRATRRTTTCNEPCLPCGSRCGWISRTSPLSSSRPIESARSTDRPVASARSTSSTRSCACTASGDCSRPWCMCGASPARGSTRPGRTPGPVPCTTCPAGCRPARSTRSRRG